MITASRQINDGNFWRNELKGNSREEIATRGPQSRRAPQVPAQRAVFGVLREMPRPLEARHKTTAATDPPHRSPIFEAALGLSPVLLPEPAVPASAIDFPSAAPRNFSKAARCSAVFCVNSTPMPFSGCMILTSPGTRTSIPAARIDKVTRLEAGKGDDISR